MIATLLRWSGYVLFAIAAASVGISVWFGVQGDAWGASSFVYAFGPVVAGLVLIGLSKMMDDVAATREAVERQGLMPPSERAD